MKKIFFFLCMGLAFSAAVSCQKMLSDQVPQGTLSDEQVKSPANAEAMVVSAGILMSVPTMPTKVAAV